MENNQTGHVVPYLAEMFRYQAWIALGKIAHPVSQEVERNLEVAKQSIDLLAELEAKTQGNLSDDENKLIQAMLAELRMNYVDEAKKPDPVEDAGTKEEAATDGETVTASTAESGDTPGTEEAHEEKEN